MKPALLKQTCNEKLLKLGKSDRKGADSVKNYTCKVFGSTSDTLLKVRSDPILEN